MNDDKRTAGLKAVCEESLASDPEGIVIITLAHGDDVVVRYQANLPMILVAAVTLYADLKREMSEGTFRNEVLEHISEADRLKTAHLLDTIIAMGLSVAELAGVDVGDGPQRRAAMEHIN